MKEVNLQRYAGRFEENAIPFRNSIQSPIGLVPKAGGQSRLIFHLSYNFKNGNKSVNSWTPKDLCSVKYHDLDHVIENSLKLLKQVNEDASMSMKGVIFYSKCDLKSAFRILPLFVKDRAWLIMMAKDPKTGKKYYFIEKNLPFGASISCALFQEFSDSLQYITEHLIGEKDRVTNYLDDFLFIALLEIRCNQMMETFVEMCKTINCPLSPEKSEAASPLMIFLGVLLNGIVWHCQKKRGPRP